MLTLRTSHLRAENACFKDGVGQRGCLVSLWKCREERGREGRRELSIEAGNSQSEWKTRLSISHADRLSPVLNICSHLVNVCVPIHEHGCSPWRST